MLKHRPDVVLGMAVHHLPRRRGGAPADRNLVIHEQNSVPIEQQVLASTPRGVNERLPDVLARACGAQSGA